MRARAGLIAGLMEDLITDGASPPRGRSSQWKFERRPGEGCRNAAQVLENDAAGAGASREGWECRGRGNTC